MSLLGGIDGAIAASGRAYAKIVIDTEPVAWWPLNGDLADRIGARDGTIGAGAEVHAGSLPADHGGGFDCAGTNWISVAHAAILKPQIGSVMVWFKPNAVSERWILSADEIGVVDGNFALQTQASGQIQALWQAAGISTIIQTVTPYYGPGQIIQAIASWDDGGVALYLDGNRIARSTAHTSGLAGNTQPWHFGHSHLGGGEIFNGVIDEIAIWDRVLTRNEIYLLAQTEPT